MKKNQNKGITLIEGLVIIAGVALVLTLCALALFGARKEARDVKRVSDMQVMRSTMASIKVQFGSYLESGCQAGPVYNCQDTNLEVLMPTIVNFRDPKGDISCAQSCTSGCEYAFTELNEDSFTLLFYLEKGVGQFNEAGCYALTERGIEKQ